MRVFINGFGRIGRNVLRAIVESGRTDIEVIAINDLGPVETNAHLIRFDSVHGMLSLISTTTIFGTPVDVTLQELAVESFFPADEFTARVLREMAAAPS